MSGLTGGDIISLLFWILFFYLLFHPQAQIKSLQSTRLKLIKKIEDKYRWRVITMIHRQERIGFLGFLFIDI